MPKTNYELPESSRLSLQRLAYPEDALPLGLAWGWMQLQPELYRDCFGFANFGIFTHLPETMLNLSIWRGETMLALVPLIWRYQKPCEVGVITPPRPNVRDVIAGLRLIENEIFGPLGYDAFFVRCKEPARRIAEWYGLRESSQRNLFFRSKYDVERKQHGAAASGRDRRSVGHAGVATVCQLPT